jgi:hypothetical protein
MYFRDRLYVPDSMELKRKILDEAFQIVFTIFPLLDMSIGEQLPCDDSHCTQKRDRMPSPTLAPRISMPDQLLGDTLFEQARVSPAISLSTASSQTGSEAQNIGPWIMSRADEYV